MQMVGGDPSAYLAQSLSQNPSVRQFVQANGGMTIGQMVDAAPDSPVKPLVQAMMRTNGGFSAFMQANGGKTLGQLVGERFGMTGGPL